MFGIFKGFTEFIFGSAIKVKSPVKTVAPYKLELPNDPIPTSSEIPAPPRPNLILVDTKPVVETVTIEVPAKKTRKPRKPKAVSVPVKEPEKSAIVKIAEVKKGKGKSKKS